MTWAMSMLVGVENGDTDRAEWLLTSLAAKGCTDAIRQAATSALLGGVLATTSLRSGLFGLALEPTMERLCRLTTLNHIALGLGPSRFQDSCARYNDAPTLFWRGTKREVGFRHLRPDAVGQPWPALVDLP